MCVSLLPCMQCIYTASTVSIHFTLYQVVSILKSPPSAICPHLLLATGTANLSGTLSKHVK